MAQRKKKYPPRRQKSVYLKNIQERQATGYEIVSDWTAQLALDTLAIILNDPKVMGRNTFGAKRLQKICEAFNERWPQHKIALSAHPEAEYMRSKIDQAQAAIFGPEYTHWQDRYAYWDENDTY